ncbi:LAME_0H19174g1_1 [Lachancea meyersii CBS 8951]|uniref:LAME_0H19174g1_1 n=1 Tax=Lachancea meyersii CBS 8951 TaxID=1266667 RepID=A0A1G4KJ68_9SACH|nr:LAME_0H19174g1_1 [Lachancea meyersii CBS 8951]
MIIDQYVLGAFEEIDKTLEIALRQSSLTHQRQSQPSNRAYLKKLQDQLWLVQNEVTLLKAGLTQGKRQHRVSFPVLENVLHKLQQQEEDVLRDFVAVSGDVENSVRSAIDQYVSVCLYYSVVQKSLKELPLVSDTAIYYGDVHDATRWSLLYALQVLPNRLVRILRRSVQNDKKYISRAHLARDLKALGHGWYDYLLRKADRMVMIQNFQLVGLPNDAKKVARSIFALPLAAVRQEVDANRVAAEELFDGTTRKLGSLLGQFPNTHDFEERTRLLASFFDHNARESSPNGAEKVLLDLVSKMTVPSPMKYVEKPGCWTRYWPSIFAVLTYGPGSAIAIWQSRYKIVQFCQENIVDFCAGLVQNWIWVPLQQVWSTVRHDEKNSTLAIASKGSLDSEFSSLTRMVVQLVAENSDQPVDTTNLAAQVETGNLTEFMQIYEHQLHHPIKNIMTGKLVRSLLIQLQKTKVDGSLALSGIDQLLQSQQLVFGVVAMSPAVLILYVLWTCAYRLTRLGRLWSNAAQLKYKLSSSLNNIERLLNYNHHDVNVTDKDLNTGLLALEVVSARQCGDRLIPKNRRSEWIRDVGELVDTNLGHAARLNVMNRIYHVYGRFLT